MSLPRFPGQTIAALAQLGIRRSHNDAIAHEKIEGLLRAGAVRWLSVENDLRLSGYGISLEPLRPEHSAALHALTDEQLWAGMTSPYPHSVAEYKAHVERQNSAAGTLAFAVVQDDGRVSGSTSLYELSPAQQRVEIGSTWYGREFWGGHTNPAAKRLLFGYVFDTLELYRVGLRCDARNMRSATAIQRLGGVPEGVLRGHRVAADGSRGDTAYFSVLRPEWPAVRAGLDARLAGR